MNAQHQLISVRTETVAQRCFEGAQC